MNNSCFIVYLFNRNSKTLFFNILFEKTRICN